MEQTRETSEYGKLIYYHMCRLLLNRGKNYSRRAMVSVQIATEFVLKSQTYGAGSPKPVISVQNPHLNIPSFFIICRGGHMYPLPVVYRPSTIPIACHNSDVDALYTAS